MTRGLLFVLLLTTGVALAEDVPKDKRAKAPAASPEKALEKTQETAPEKAKEDPNLGMSILGNQEAPKSLVIVPWKSSELGNALDIATMLGDSRQPIDKDVFMRALSYYEIRAETGRHDGAPAAGRETAPAGRDAAHRRKP